MSSFTARDWHQYLYVVASTKSVIFALAVGMNTIGFRLDDRMKSRALASGAEQFTALGAEWVSFTLFRDDWPERTWSSGRGRLTWQHESAEAETGCSTHAEAAFTEGCCKQRIIHTLCSSNPALQL